jgi:CRP/FNR family transcriptional regulator
MDEGEWCILSASCVLSSITFDVHIDAEWDTELLIIAAPYFRRLTTNNIYVECLAYKMATDGFSEVMWAMQQMLFMSFDKRLAVFLWDESSARGSDTIKMTHEQVAKMTGSAREVVTRMLKSFANNGIVELSRGGIKIIDKEKLRHLTE